MSLQLAISKGGEVRGIYSDELVPLVARGASVARASHVEPCEGGGWQVDLSPLGGPVLRGFVLRSIALEAEVAWIQRHRIELAEGEEI